VADPAEDALVPSAACGLYPDGRAAPGRVLASLLRRPQDLPGVLRIARQSAQALKALRLAVTRATA
jgi:adenosylhomocysteine nucleosidase